MNQVDEKSILLRISYHGFAYYGWAMQKNLPTIEQMLRSTWQNVFGYPVRAFASSRTDAHVHALDQWVKIMAKEIISSREEIVEKLNQSLPGDIKVIEARDCSKGFNIIGSAKSKEYCYLFANELPQNLVNADQKIFHIIEDLNFENMQLAAQLFLGTHSFHNYQRREKNTAVFVREVLESKVSLIDHWQGVKLDRNIYCYSIISKGFLRQMVRIIVGAILNVGQGKKTIDELIKSFNENGDTKQHVGFVSPGHGLYLNRINF